MLNWESPKNFELKKVGAKVAIDDDGVQWIKWNPYCGDPFSTPTTYVTRDGMYFGGFPDDKQANNAIVTYIKG
jgi:hypothetical protein